MHLLELGTAVPDPMAPYREVDRSSPRHECWVAAHMVAGLDGTAAVDGRVGALSTSPDQDLFRDMREIPDVVLVGAETVRLEGYGPVRLSDDSQARRRNQGKADTPPIAVVSRSLDLDPAASVFADAPEHAPTMVVTCAAADPDRRSRVDEFAEVIEAGDDKVDPARALRALADRECDVVLCEGGPTWLGELVAADRLDELLLTVTPMMGGDALPVSVTQPGSGVARFDLMGAMSEDGTLFLRYEVARSGSHCAHGRADR